MSSNHPGCSLDTLKWFQSLTDTLAQWVEHHMQSQKVAGSIPASVTFPNQPQVRFINGKLCPQWEIIMYSTGHYWGAQREFSCLIGIYVLNWTLLESSMGSAPWEINGVYIVVIVNNILNVKPSPSRVLT